MRHPAAVVFLAAFLPLSVFAQTTASQDQTAQPAVQSQPPGSGTGTSSTTSGKDSAKQNRQQPSGSTERSKTPIPKPIPYTTDEFPPWANDLRRAEIITIGAFPISLLVTSLTYQLVRYAEHGFSRAYAPTLIGSGSTPLSDQEKIGVILSGMGVSMLVAAADFGLGKTRSTK